MNTQELADTVGRNEKVVREWSRQLPTEAVLRKGAATEWSTGDVVGFLVLQHLVERGLPEAVALSIVRELLPSIPDMVAEDGSTWLLAWPDRQAASGWCHLVTNDPEEALATVERLDDVSRFAVHGMVRTALIQIAEATIGARPR